jgi:hypothetical protein
MSHATGVLEPSRTTTCQDWCVATHIEDDTPHLQLDTPLPVAGGRHLEASIYFDERKGTAGIYLGDYEMSAEQARGIIRKLADLADLADAVLRGRGV